MPELLSWETGDGKPTATRENLRTALELLSGNDVRDENRASLPNADQLQKVTPDDLVLIAFSCHGYTDLRGRPDELITGTIKDVRSRQVKPIKTTDAEHRKAQTPELFDYAKKRPRYSASKIKARR